MRQTPNPLLTFLVRHDTKPMLTWRMTLALVFAIFGICTVLLIGIKVSTPDYFITQHLLGVFDLVYLFYIGASLVVPLLLAAAATILTSTWTGRDEKFELILLTPLPERTILEAYVLAVAYRMRLLLGIHLLFTLLTPLLIVVHESWGIEDNLPKTVLGLIADYLLFVLLNFALTGLWLIGTIIGVRFGIRARYLTDALNDSVGWTCLSMLGLIGVTCVGQWFVGGFLVLLKIEPLRVYGFCCVGTLCVLPVFSMLVGYLKIVMRSMSREELLY